MHSFIHIFCAYPQPIPASRSCRWWISQGGGAGVWILSAALYRSECKAGSNLLTAFPQASPRLLCMADVVNCL